MLLKPRALDSPVLLFFSSYGLEWEFEHSLVFFGINVYGSIFI